MALPTWRRHYHGDSMRDAGLRTAENDFIPKVTVVDNQGNAGLGTVNTTAAITANDSFSIDPFGAWRVSQRLTIFDSKQNLDKRPLFWDDQEVSGTGTGSTWSKNEAATTISVGATTAGKRVRQTFQRFNYQPGKGQRILVTFGEFDTDTGITKEVGYFDGSNGLFFRSAAGVVSVVRRTNVTGTPTDNVVTQANWNIDAMDGTGPSGVTLDFTKTQIGFIDFEWLGVGRVRMGFVIDGKIYYVHAFNNANNLTTVYMSTPNLPLRYSIENDGNGAADDFVHICSAVESEGGQDQTGVLRHADSGAISSLGTNTVYAMLGIRLKSTHLDASVLIENISAICSTANDQAHWELRFNPTVAGTFTYADQTNSAVQIATGATANTVTGGYEIDGGYFSTAVPVSPTTPNALKIGSNIAATVRDTIVLCVRPITNNITAQASMTWREES